MSAAHDFDSMLCSVQHLLPVVLDLAFHGTPTPSLVHRRRPGTEAFRGRITLAGTRCSSLRTVAIRSVVAFLGMH